MKEIQDFLSKKEKESLWVVQKYIEKPLLYHGRKFDIRVWALFTGDRKAYFYNQGYIRTSSEDYQLSNTTNYIHLTNNCLQKHFSSYSKHEPGNTLSFSSFSSYLSSLPSPLPLSSLLPRITDLILDVFHASKSHLLPKPRGFPFELLGFDFLIDEDFRVWLLEVNTNPYLGTPNEHMKVLIDKMLKDLLEIVLRGKIEKGGDNGFTVVCCEEEGVCERREFGEGIYPDQGKKPEANRNWSAGVGVGGRGKKEGVLGKCGSLMFNELKSLLMADNRQLLQKFLDKLFTKIDNWQNLNENEIHDISEAFRLLTASEKKKLLWEKGFFERIGSLIEEINLPIKIMKILVIFL